MSTCLGLFGSSSLPRFTRYARAGRNLLITAPSGGVFSFWAGANPPVLSNDWAAAQKTTTPGDYSITVDADGIATVSTDDTSRQSVKVDYYSRRKLRWLNDATQYVNNQAPVGTPQTFSFVAGVNAGSRDLKSAFTDAEGDALTVVFSFGTIPAGMQIVGSLFFGTPTLISDGSFVMTATDITGDASTAQITWHVTSASVGTPGDLLNEVRLKSLIGGTLIG